jgi:hypothetical protein
LVIVIGSPPELALCHFAWSIKGEPYADHVRRNIKMATTLVVEKIRKKPEVENSQMKKIAKHFAVALVSAVLATGSVAVSNAAEDAGGVVKYIGMSYDSAKAALDAAKVGDKQKTTESLKQVRQYSKEITGDAAGMKLQKVNQAVKAAGNAVDACDMAKAVELLGPAVKSLEEMKNAK